MAGIYLHIPFCKTRCIYCDFFSSTSMKTKGEYVDAMCKEIRLQKSYLQNQPVSTIYFGGGTPSQLSSDDFKLIFDELQSGFNLENLKEVTLEANPDDISISYLKSMADLPFNRISMGVQSFNDEELLFLKRRHDSRHAIRAVKECQSFGYNNISIDLIYGLPGQTMEIWEENLHSAVELDIQHISAYHLIYEEDTTLYKLLLQNKISPVKEELSLDMFARMIDYLSSAGFEHYEISNFGKETYHSMHNSSYWNGTHYLGIGASAHSYNGKSRSWNLSSLKEYISSIQKGTIPAEEEIIDQETAYNDYILTRMRTSQGIDIKELSTLFGSEMESYCLLQVRKHIQNRTVTQDNNILKLSRKGIFVSDGIMSDMMRVKN